MKKLLIALVLVGSSAHGFSPERQATVSKLCSMVAEQASNFAEARQQGWSWKKLSAEVNMDTGNTYADVINSVLRDAYYRGLGPELSRTLGYTDCMTRMKAGER